MSPTALVALLAWHCPGGWFGGLVPPAVQPLVCKAEVQVEAYEDVGRGRRRLAELGPAVATTLYTQDHLRLKAVPVTWTPN